VFYNQVGGAVQELGRQTAQLGSEEERAFDQAGRAIGGGIAAAGKQYVDYEDHKEISQGAASFATLHSDLTDQWNNVAKTADPNDTSVAGKYRETVLEPALDKFREGFTTEKAQQWAENHIDALRTHLVEKVQADMSSRAADAVAVNVRKTTNAWTNTARNDPSAVPFLLETADQSIGGIVSTSPNLKGATAAKVQTEVAQKAKEDIVRAGALGAIEKAGDPEKAWQVWAQRYPDLINSQEMDQFAKTAKMYRRMNDAEGKAAQADQKRQAVGAFHQDANKWELSTIDENGNATLPPDAVKGLKDMVAKYGDNADPGRVTAMVRRVQELGKVLDPASAANLKKTSDANEHDLRTSMVLPQPGAAPVTEDQINRAYASQNPKEQISFAARNRLLKELQEDKSPDGQTLAKARGDFFRNFASTIDPGRDQSTGAGASALGSQKIGEAQAEARRMEGVLRSQGKDPHSLYDPKSPDYFGNTVTKFRPTLAEKAAFDAQLKADQAAKPGAAAPPAGPKPGDRQQFKQGWGVWNGTAWVPEKP
jgi:hypothetical protein